MFGLVRQVSACSSLNRILYIDMHRPQLYTLSRQSRDQRVSRCLVQAKLCNEVCVEACWLFPGNDGSHGSNGQVFRVLQKTKNPMISAEKGQYVFEIGLRERERERELRHVEAFKAGRDKVRAPVVPRPSFCQRWMPTTPGQQVVWHSCCLNVG